MVGCRLFLGGCWCLEARNLFLHLGCKYVQTAFCLEAAAAEGGTCHAGGTPPTMDIGLRLFYLGGGSTGREGPQASIRELLLRQGKSAAAGAFKLHHCSVRDRVLEYTVHVLGCNRVTLRKEFEEGPSSWRGMVLRTS